MILEIIILLEVVAFLFLALGIIPYGERDIEKGNLPIANKVIFLLVSTIMFFSLAMTTAQYDYTYCFVNGTTSDFISNITTTDATCNQFQIENIGLSYINWGMGFVGIVLMIVITMIALASKNDIDYLNN